MKFECAFCQGCGGTYDRHGDETPCPHCHGTGWVIVEPKSDQELEKEGYHAEVSDL